MTIPFYVGNNGSLGPSTEDVGMSSLGACVFLIMMIAVSIQTKHLWCIIHHPTRKSENSSSCCFMLFPQVLWLLILIPQSPSCWYSRIGNNDIFLPFRFIVGHVYDFWFTMKNKFCHSVKLEMWKIMEHMKLSFLNTVNNEWTFFVNFKHKPYKAVSKKWQNLFDSYLFDDMWLVQEV